jgi:hypothetical protein
MQRSIVFGKNGRPDRSVTLPFLPRSLDWR